MATIVDPRKICINACVLPLTIDDDEQVVTLASEIDLKETARYMGKRLAIGAVGLEAYGWRWKVATKK